VGGKNFSLRRPVMPWWPPAMGQYHARRTRTIQIGGNDVPSGLGSSGAAESHPLAQSSRRTG